MSAILAAIADRDKAYAELIGFWLHDCRESDSRPASRLKQSYPKKYEPQVTVESIEYLHAFDMLRTLESQGAIAYLNIRALLRYGTYSNPKLAGKSTFEVGGMGGVGSRTRTLI